MGHGRQLSVITAVSRPENLPLIAWSVPEEAEWVLVTDGPREIPSGLRSHRVIEGPRTGQWGDVQRRIGLEAATRPFVYFLDDDNLMLPILGDLVIPFLEIGNHPGALFGLVVNLENETHLWPAPERVTRGQVDTAMFLGRRSAILELRFLVGSHAGLWPDMQGERHGDFVFLETFEKQFGLAKLPAIHGFHNGLNFLRNCEPAAFSDLESGACTCETLMAIFLRRLIRADVPQWWRRNAATA